MALGEFDRQELPRRVAAEPSSPQQTLGIVVSEITPQVVRELPPGTGIEPGMEGLLVTRVAPYGAAATVLQPGDVILEFNRQPVRTVRDLERAADGVDPGDIVVLRVRSIVTGNVGVRSFRVR